MSLFKAAIKTNVAITNMTSKIKLFYECEVSNLVFFAYPVICVSCFNIFMSCDLAKELTFKNIFDCSMDLCFYYVTDAFNMKTLRNNKFFRKKSANLHFIH